MNLDNFVMNDNDGPSRIGLFSLPGWGKTTFLAHMPAPVIIGAEKGLPRDLGFVVPHAAPRAWLDVFDLIESLRTGDHRYRTVGIDTLDWLEPLIYRFLVDRDSKRKSELNPKGHELISIEDYGWGKGYVAAEEEFRKLITVLDILQAERAMHVVFLAHNKVATFKNPTGPDFDRHEPKCHARITNVLNEYVEHMIFGFYEINTAKEQADVERNEKTARVKGVGEGKRMVGLRQCAMYDAKNRAGLPSEMEYGEPVDLIERLLGIQKYKPMRIKRGDFDRPADRKQPAPRAERRIDPPGTVVQDRGVESPRDDLGTQQPVASRPAPQRDPIPTRAPEPAAPSREQPAQMSEAERYYRAAMELVKGADDAYNKKIEGWIKQADGDRTKLDAIARRVHADLAPKKEGSK